MGKQTKRPLQGEIIQDRYVSRSISKRARSIIPPYKNDGIRRITPFAGPAAFGGLAKEIISKPKGDTASSRLSQMGVTILQIPTVVGVILQVP